jgi:tetratricopeptide (TPR) repeat protein
MPSRIAQLQRQAVQLMMAGQVIAAIQAFRDLIAMRSAPFADDWFNLAYLLRCDRQFEAALDHYDRALALGINGPEEVHLNRAAIMSEHLHRQDAAIIALRAALNHNPTFLPALLNLATIYEDCGRAEEARTAYRHVLTLDPLNGRAHGRLTAIDLHQGLADAALERLNATMSSKHVRQEDRAELHFAAGLALDALQRFDEAFTHFDQGNRLARRRIDPTLAYDRTAMDTLVDALIDGYPISGTGTTTLLRPQDGNPAPIFICGLFRSGSTLAERLIGRHRLITAGGEHETIPAIVDRLVPYPQSAVVLSSDQTKALGVQYRQELDAAFPNAGIITDKRPDNFLHIGLIKQIFPDAKFVHTHRHQLDNILSIYFLYFADGVSYGFDLDDIVHYLGCHDRLMRHWRALFGNDIVELDYDALVRDPETVMRSVLTELDLPWEADCAHTANDQDAVKTASSWHVRKPLNDRSSGRWRNYAAHLADVRTKLGLA